MNENKTTTYGDLKIRKAELQREMLGGYFHNFEEYKRLLVWIKQVESVLLWSITCLIVIVALGCIENTMRGAGNAVQGIGKLVTGVGTDVVRGVDGYSQEK